MSDLNFQNLSSVQSDKQPSPPTIASATVISPLTKLTFITGTAQVATINPPVSGYHELFLIFTNGSPGATLTNGNIKNAVTPIQNLVVLAVYDPATALYWLVPGTLT